MKQICVEKNATTMRSVKAHQEGKGVSSHQFDKKPHELQSTERKNCNLQKGKLKKKTSWKRATHFTTMSSCQQQQQQKKTKTNKKSVKKASVGQEKKKIPSPLSSDILN